MIHYLSLNDVNTVTLAPFLTKKYLAWIAVLTINLCLYTGPLRSSTPTPDSEDIIIGNFSKGDLGNWKPIKFSKHTNYDLFNLDTAYVLRAHSRGAASGLIYRQKIDLHKTPQLNWSWRVDQSLSNEHEKLRKGDDFAARIYVVADGGYLPWRTKALNYVWTSKVSVNELWQNPYAGKGAMMLSIRSNESPGKTWFSESRNVCKDMKLAFGDDIRFINAIAVMTDTDDTAGTALTYYGDIYFSLN